MSSLLDAGFEADVLVQLVKEPWHGFDVPDIHVRAAARALRKREHKVVREHLGIAIKEVRSIYKKANALYVYSSQEDPAFVERCLPEALSSYLPDLLRESVVLLKDPGHDSKAKALLKQIRNVLQRNHHRINRANIGEPWSFVELEVEERDYAVTLADCIEVPYEKIEAYTYLGTRAAREGAIEEAERLWDEASQLALRCESDMVKAMLLLARSMNGIVAPNKIVGLLRRAHQTMCQGDFGGGTMRCPMGLFLGHETECNPTVRFPMELVLQYAQLDQCADVKLAIQELEPDIPFPRRPGRLFVEMVQAIAKCGLYRSALQVLLRAYPNLAFGTCISVVLPTVEGCESGLSVKILREIAAICAWVRPEWNEVTAVLTSSPSVSAAK